MRLLVDTHVLLYATAEPQKLPKASHAKLEAAGKRGRVLCGEHLEIADQAARSGGSSWRSHIEDITDAAKLMGFAELPVSAAHAASVRRGAGSNSL